MKARNARTKLLALGLALALAGCSSAPAENTSSGPADSAPASSAVSQPSSQPEDSESAAGEEEALTGEVVVFAAASLTETLTELQASFQEDHPGVEITFNFDSSGTLKTQIQEGAVCDVFISAGQTQMDQLDITADASVNTEGLDFVLEGSRFDLLENKVALVVPEGNPAGIESFEDMRDGLESGTIMLAMGNSDVPVGQYTQKIFDYYGLDEAALAESGCITYGTNVKEVATQVAEATVDCGVIYATDAFSENLTVVDTATAEMCGQVIYPAAVLNISEHQEQAQDFLDFVVSDAGREVLESVGFTPLG